MVVCLKDLEEKQEQFRQELRAEYDQRIYLEVLKETLKERIRSLEQRRVGMRDTDEPEYQRLGEVIRRVEARVGGLQ